MQQIIVATFFTWCYNVAMENVNQVVAKNIATYRKASKLTQSELAQKLNFSDKSVSKWERGESLPDVSVLVQMTEIFGCSLNDLVKQPQENTRIPVPHKYKLRNRLAISLIAGGSVWLAATICYVAFIILAPQIKLSWLAFVYAVPASALVLMIFSCIWGKKWMIFTFITILIWTTLVVWCLTVQSYIWELLFVGIPLQLITILAFTIKNPAKWK